MGGRAGRSWPGEYRAKRLPVFEGLRRHELNQLRWIDFELEGPEPCVRVAAKHTKNKKPARIFLRPEAVEAVQSLKSVSASPFDHAFRQRVPSVRKLREDLADAGIDYEDECGWIVDLHAVKDDLWDHAERKWSAPKSRDGTYAAQRYSPHHENLHRQQSSSTG